MTRELQGLLWSRLTEGMDGFAVKAAGTHVFLYLLQLATAACGFHAHDVGRLWQQAPCLRLCETPY